MSSIPSGSTSASAAHEPGSDPDTTLTTSRESGVSVVDKAWFQSTWPANANFGGPLGVETRTASSGRGSLKSVACGATVQLPSAPIPCVGAGGGGGKVVLVARGWVKNGAKAGGSGS